MTHPQMTMWAEITEKWRRLEAQMKNELNDETFEHAIEEFFINYHRYMSQIAQDELENILHKYICIPRHDCACRETKEV